MTTSFDMSPVLANWTHPERKDKFLFIGTGKCGTTALVKLCTILGCHTGYTKEAVESNRETDFAFEWPCRGEKSEYYLNFTGGKMPHVIKSNLLSVDLDEVVAKFNWKPAHVFIVNRDTESTLKRNFYDRFGNEWKEKANPRKLNVRREILVNRKASLLDKIGKLDLECSIIEYPRYAQDIQYAFKKLQPLLHYYCIFYDKFKEAYNSVIDPAKVRGW